MNSSRRRAMVDSLNSIARKVYDALPVDEPMNPQSAVRLMQALGVRLELDVARGVFRVLCEKRLVKETDTAVFVKPSPKVVQFLSPASPVEPIVEIIPENTMPTPSHVAKPPVPKQVTPLDRLSEISSRFRTLAGQFNALADDLDTVGLDVAAQFQQMQKDNEKARQLKALLQEMA